MASALALLLAACCACHFGPYPPPGVGIALHHGSYRGAATWSPGNDGGTVLRVSTDDCDETSVELLRIGDHCPLRATWGDHLLSRHEDDEAMRRGVVSIDAGGPCVLDAAPGGALALRVERGTAVIGDGTIQLSFEGSLSAPHRTDPAGARATFHFTGVWELDGHPSDCAELPKGAS